MTEHSGTSPHSAADKRLDTQLDDALRVANLPTLCCLLVQLTGDMRWVEPPYVPTRTRGLDDNDAGGFSESIAAQIREAARITLHDWFAGKSPVISDPSDALLVRLMSTSLGEDIPLQYAPMIRNELGMTQPAAAVQPSASSPTTTTQHTKVDALIIGAGISGLCAAKSFDDAGIRYTIIERHANIGGVWLENRYPGAACDVPSHLYSFSFAPYDWSRFFAGRDEIHAYLEYVANHFDIRRHIRFNTSAQQARFDEANGQWELDVINSAGQPETLRATLLISAVGAFNKPRIPAVPGAENFAGVAVHTARWPAEDIDLTGRKVVVVGNGASAMQVVPAIADRAGSVTIIQHSPQWAAPFGRFRQDVPESLRWLLREVPLYRRWYRLRLSWAFNDKTYEALQIDRNWPHPDRSINAINDAHRRGLTEYITAELGDRQDLLPMVLPTYPPFGKRMLLDNGWFRTLRRDNVRLVCDRVSSMDSHRVNTANGDTHDCDVLIWATGFDVVNFLAPMDVFGRGGRRLHDDWQGDDARAYIGSTVPGYPNFFCLYGPNTQFGHGGSLITVVERQMHFIMTLLQQMLSAGLGTVEVRESVHDEYNERVDETHRGMVWSHRGMDTYYRNSKGRVVVNNPFRIIEYWQMTEQANIEDFITAPTPGSDANESADANARSMSHG